MKDKNNVNKSSKIIKENFKFSEVIVIIFITLVIGIIIGYAVNVNFSSNKEKKDDNLLDEFIETYNDIKDNYYEDINEKDLINGAISGMLGMLDDPYSTYIDEDNINDFNDRLNGSYSGIGIEIATDQEYRVVIANVFNDSPASRAGLKVGDIFKKIDNTDVSKLTSTDISSMIKNSNKKEISITVARSENEITLTLKPEIIELDSIKSKVIDYNSKKIGYIDIDLFALNTYQQFKHALESLEKEGIESLIIDVRSNTGGYLDIVTEMTSLFLKEQQVIYQLNEKEETTKILDQTKEHRNYNIVVLINEYSASASEILASSLQESYGAKLVGMNTYGKGTVQQTKDLDKTGGMLKYTVQKWLTPKGDWINEKGVAPDIEVQIDEKYFETLTEDDDNQFQKALEVVSQ